jgi:hypothetical protein
VWMSLRPTAAPTPGREGAAARFDPAEGCAIVPTEKSREVEVEGSRLLLGAEGGASESRIVTMLIAGRKHRWAWFVAWALAGACVAFGAIEVGVLIVPISLGLLIALSVRRRGPAALGVVAGIGAVLTGIGGLHLDYHACNSTRGNGHLAAGATRSISGSCGGVDGLPWMIVGVFLLAVATLIYLRVTHRTPPGGTATSVSPLAG